MADEMNDATQTSATKKRKTMPKGDAKPLGTKSTPKSARAKSAAQKSSAVVEKNSEKVIDNAASTAVDSSSTRTADSVDSAEIVPPLETGSDAHITKEEKKVMQITLTKSNKNRKSTSIVFTAANGVRGSVRFAKTLFAGGNAPDTLVIENDAFAEPKAKLTPEQRKEQRKNAPKLTAAQKLAKLQERAARLQAKIAAEAAQPAGAAQ